MHKLIRKIPKGAVPDRWAVNIFGKWFRVYTTTNGLRIAKQERNIIKSATTMYVTDPKDLSDEVALIPAVTRLGIENDIALGRMRYEDGNTLFAFVNLTYNI